MSNFSSFFTFGGLSKEIGMNIMSNDNKINKILNDKTIVLTQNNDDGSAILDDSNSWGYNQSFLEISKDYQTQKDLINEYREMSTHPETDSAIDDIVNEAITCDDDENPISLNLEQVELSENIKKKMREEHEYLMDLMDFNETAYEKFRSFYIDGRLVLHPLIDDSKPKLGIQKINILDPRAVKKIQEVKKETDRTNGVDRITDISKYYIYDQTFSYAHASAYNRSVQSTPVRMSEDSLIFIHSGLFNPDRTMVLGFLDKARKPLNSLKMLEDSLVVYRITRAPERRAFYIDVGDLQKKSAEEYVANLMNKFKNRMVYDKATGTVNGNTKQMSMLEDFWLPRREGKGTQIETLPGGDNLGQIDDVLYFQKKLYKSLNVPANRLDDSGSMINLGSDMGEITREEWKFSKFVQRLRRRFVGALKELLKRQLILKNIITEIDWEDNIAPKIKYDFASDTFVADRRASESLSTRISNLDQISQYVGKYFSRETVFRDVLMLTDEQVEEELKRIEKEKSEGVYKTDEEENNNGGF